MEEIKLKKPKKVKVPLSSFFVSFFYCPGSFSELCLKCCFLLPNTHTRKMKVRSNFLHIRYFLLEIKAQCYIMTPTKGDAFILLLHLLGKLPQESMGVGEGNEHFCYSMGDWERCPSFFTLFFFSTLSEFQRINVSPYEMFLTNALLLFKMWNRSNKLRSSGKPQKCYQLPLPGVFSDTGMTLS